MMLINFLHIGFYVSKMNTENDTGDDILAHPAELCQ